VLSFTGGDDGTTAAEEQRRRRCGFELKRQNACVRRAKEGRGSSRLSLYSVGRILGGVKESFGGGALPLMAAGISGQKWGR
jgi:hypothetical protein